MYLLDTNHCSRLIDGEPEIVRIFEEKGEALVATSVIVRGELRFMAHNSERKEANLARIDAFLESIGLYFVDEETANNYGELKATLLRHYGPKEKSKRRRVTMTQLGFDENDLWLVATALQHGLTIVSSDTDFPRIQTAQAFGLESWWRQETS